jgi:two-component system cell cycle response regulator
VNKIKLLVIEDDRDQRELIQHTLEDHFGPGTVVGAEDGRRALAEDLASFDLILCDFNLPDVSGLELVDRIRQCCSTPIVMVTGENVTRTAAEAIRRGATDYIVKAGDYLLTIPLVIEKNLTLAKIKRENEHLRADLEKALYDLRTKNTELEKSLRRVEEMAATDPLTGLYNRRHFGKVLEQLHSESLRYSTSLSCVMIDLDGYKQLNDTFGHAVGDQLLVVAGKVIAANMRRMDIAARYGGDEFILLLPHANIHEASAVVDRLREEYRLASAVVLRRNDGVSMSVGIASLGPEHAAGDQLVAAADAALYRAKRAGRGRSELHDGLRDGAAAQLHPIELPQFKHL